ncbi:MAG: hypothetical protein WA728_32880 [Xanthobacteraceae bacterium]
MTTVRDIRDALLASYSSETRAEIEATQAQIRAGIHKLFRSDGTLDYVEAKRIKALAQRRVDQFVDDNPEHADYASILLIGACLRILAEEQRLH